MLLASYITAGKSDDSFPRTKGYRDIQSEKINDIKDSIDKLVHTKSRTQVSSNTS